MQRTYHTLWRHRHALHRAYNSVARALFAWANRRSGTAYYIAVSLYYKPWTRTSTRMPFKAAVPPHNNELLSSSLVDGILSFILFRHSLVT